MECRKHGARLLCKSPGSLHRIDAKACAGLPACTYFPTARCLSVCVACFCPASCPFRAAPPCARRKRRPLGRFLLTTRNSSKRTFALCWPPIASSATVRKSRRRGCGSTPARRPCVAVTKARSSSPAVRTRANCSRLFAIPATSRCPPRPRCRLSRLNCSQPGSSAVRHGQNTERVSWDQATTQPSLLRITGPFNRFAKRRCPWSSKPTGSNRRSTPLCSRDWKQQELCLVSRPKSGR